MDDPYLPVVTKIFTDSAVPFVKFKDNDVNGGVTNRLTKDIYSFLSFLVKDISSFGSSPPSQDGNTIVFFSDS